MKTYWLIPILLFSATIQAQTIGPGCQVAWDYDPADLERIDGFRLYVDGAAALDVDKAAQTATCAALALQQGQRTIEATAFNSAGESERSDPLSFVFVDSAPGKPGNVRIVVSF